MHCSIFGLFLLLTCSIQTTVAFWALHKCQSKHSFVRAETPRYDPSDPIDVVSSEVDSEAQQKGQTDVFRSLIQQLLVVEQQYVPSLLTNNMEVLLEVLPQPEILESIVDENPTQQEEVIAIINYLGTFVEAFVEEAKEFEKGYKELLGDILRVMHGDNEWSNKEDKLDEFLASHSDALTPGFLRHLEGECERMENSPRTTPESKRLSEIVRTIRVRIVEELGKKTLGEGAAVLSQLLAYDDEKERKAVMQAGLELRGLEFALELESMSKEALQTMETVDADLELVYRLTGLHEGIQSFIESKNSKQP